MIRFESVSFSYQQDSDLVINDFNFNLMPGEFTLVLGRTGSGKSTLLNLVNGTAPYLTGGYLVGDVEVFGLNTKSNRPRDYAELVGVVNQKPRNSFVTSTTQDELAYSMECQGIDPKVMRQRIDETIDIIGLSDALDQPIETLSAGQQQRVAIGAVLVNRPKVLVLDEPTSALDPAAAEDVLSMLQRLTHDLDVSILVAEHKLERILQFAERVVYLPGAGKPIVSGPAGDVMAVADLAPPIIHLAKEMNWEPLPLNVREARKFTLPLIDKLSSIQTVKPSSTEKIAAVENLTVQFGHTAAIDNVSIEIQSGRTYAVLGRNGAGKSTLLASLAGLIEPTIGSIKVQGQNPSTLSGFKFLKSIGFVPQEPSDLLLQTSIQDECSLTDRNSSLDNGTTQQFVQEFLPSVDLRQHPLDLSEGQQLLLTLALILVNSPKLILLDEPTRGLDYLAKIDLIAHLQKIENLGVAIVIATHDVELVAELKATVLLLADGKIVASGPSREVLVHSFAYTPQIARAFNPINLLTVSEAVDAIKLAG